jgi:hypothetical protein
MLETLTVVITALTAAGGGIAWLAVYLSPGKQEERLNTQLADIDRLIELNHDEGDASQVDVLIGKRHQTIAVATDNAVHGYWPIPMRAVGGIGGALLILVGAFGCFDPDTSVATIVMSFALGFVFMFGVFVCEWLMKRDTSQKLEGFGQPLDEKEKAEHREQAIQAALKRLEARNAHDNGD